MSRKATPDGHRRIFEHGRSTGTPPLVSIICITYNHEKYIEECLRGFLMQETTFPVEIIVHDDASNDGTPTILKQYAAEHPGLFHLILQEENQFSRNIRPTPIAIAAATGRYLAFCDGDDYWTDPRKLECQVQHLEDSPNSKLCFHRVSLLSVDGKSMGISTAPDFELKEKYEVVEIMRSNLIPTSSVVVCRDAVASTPDWFSHMLMNDWPRWVLACENEKAEAINKVMAVYRIHNASVWQGAKEETRLMAIFDFYCVMGIFAPQKIKAIADSEKKKIVYKLQHYQSLLEENSKFKSNLERLTDHPVLGRVLRLWKVLINPSLPI